MTAEDIIAANSDRLLNAEATEIGGLPCVIGDDAGLGEQIVIFYRGDIHVDCRRKDAERSLQVIDETLTNGQPGEVYATVFDDRLAANYKALGIPFHTDAERHVHGGLAP